MKEIQTNQKQCQNTCNGRKELIKEIKKEKKTYIATSLIKPKSRGEEEE